MSLCCQSQGLNYKHFLRASVGLVSEGFDRLGRSWELLSHVMMYRQHFTHARGARFSQYLAPKIVRLLGPLQMVWMQAGEGRDLRHEKPEIKCLQPCLASLQVGFFFG